MLEVRYLNAWYGPAQVLFDITLDVPHGQVTALLGRNGAGKSTIFKSLIGFGPRRKGAIRFAGRDISDLPSYAIARLGLGYVPEERRIFTDLTVEENLAVGRQAPRPGFDPWTPQRLYAYFPNLAEIRKRPAGRISGGEQQMLTIARTLMGNPTLLLLDEPSEGLAPKIVEEMAVAILAMKREGMSLLVSEPNLHFARLIADRAIILESGRVCFSDTMQALKADTATHNAHLSI